MNVINFNGLLPLILREHLPGPNTRSLSCCLLYRPQQNLTFFQGDSSSLSIGTSAESRETQTAAMVGHPGFDFGFHASVAEFAASKQSYLAAHPGAPFAYIATSTLVLDSSNASRPRVLLLQRAAEDEDPNKWEPPGGACDDEDVSILHAAARELWEEAGLQAAQIKGLSGDPFFFTLSDGKKVCQFNFAMRVKVDSGTPPVVRLNPKEHQRFVWATEDEVRARKADGMDLDFTRIEVERAVLQNFRQSRENQEQQG